MASSVKTGGGTPCRSRASWMKWLISLGMSSRRSRSAGKWMFTALSR